MTESGHGAQIVHVVNERFVLDKDKLKAVLEREDISDLPAVVVSVAGVYRGGKSFLLNFFLRYLLASPSARADGTWLGVPGEPLEGFSWRYGSTRNTTGILMWSEPIVCTRPNGEKVAVFLMDTQGTFDNSTTIAENTTVFALSTLLSSVQIYNIMRNIQEDNLGHLHLFTEYGRLVANQGNGIAFQNLLFLVRDWPYEDEQPYGAEGGRRKLDTVLQITENMKPELKDVRAHIRSCFEKVSAFLMPEPGDKVRKKKFTGSIDDINDDFKMYLKELVYSIFAPENLQPKVINGRVITVGELKEYFYAYLKEFSDGNMPKTGSILRATTEANLLSLLLQGEAEYEKEMNKECGEDTKSVPAVDIKVLHDRFKEKVLKNFQSKKKMGKKEDAEEYYKKLSEEIENRSQKYTSLNAVKQNKVSKAALKVYDDKIAEVTKDKVFCVHAKDVKAIHNTAADAALIEFDNGRKRITSNSDPERNDFVKQLQNKYSLLYKSNETNNTRIISDLLEYVYWQPMKNSISDLPHSKSELQTLHGQFLAKLLTEFKKKRIQQHHYNEDEYENNLIGGANQYHEEFKKLMKSVNREALIKALNDYKKQIDSAWDRQQQHLHPEDLKREHETAKCKALSSLRPKYNTCTVDETDEDESTLISMLASRYDYIYKTNDMMNKEAIQSALNVFEETYAERKRPSWAWLAVVPAVVSVVKTLNSDYFSASVEDARREFYRKRRNPGPEDTDVYLRELMKKLDTRKPFAWLTQIFN